MDCRNMLSIKFPRWSWRPSVWGPPAWVNPKSKPENPSVYLSSITTEPDKQTKQLIQIYCISDLTWVSHIKRIYVPQPRARSTDLGQRYSFRFTLSKLTSQLTLPNSIFTNSMHSWRYLLLHYQHIWCQIPSEDAYITPFTSRGSNVGVTLVRIIKLGLQCIQIVAGTLKIIQKNCPLPI